VFFNIKRFINLHGHKKTRDLKSIIDYVIVRQDSHVTGKGKTIPIQAWTGPEGSRRLRLPDFKTIGT
jgi:hypothetical protein